MRHALHPAVAVEQVPAEKGSGSELRVRPLAETRDGLAQAGTARRSSTT